jgi:hypothetical protein
MKRRRGILASVSTKDKDKFIEEANLKIFKTNIMQQS